LEILRTILIPVAKEGKKDNIGVVDTLRSALPWTFAWLIREVKEMIDVPIEVHCHNRWGFGTVNTLAAVTAGAKVVHATINGLSQQLWYQKIGIYAAKLGAGRCFRIITNYSNRHATTWFAG
jgi:pyruvate/oxaloacetate carboxyltransferase